MPRYALLISPRADAAYFAHVLDVARAELMIESKHIQIGSMQFLIVDTPDAELPRLARMSFVQGIFRVDGEHMVPLDVTANFKLHEDFVWGEKYRGKTNETLTQLLLNLCLQEHPDAQSLLDPMCGRGTTLFWAMRYGLNAVGVEQDPQALADIRRGVKKWTKLHRVKHALHEGWVGKANKRGTGKYLDFAADGQNLRVITGDSTDLKPLIQNRTFDILATDIPYGIQHMGGKERRNPIETLSDATPGWAAALKPGGIMAIAFNSYMPKRPALQEVFTDQGFEVIETQLAHRMSESILRDIALFRKLD